MMGGPEIKRDGFKLIQDFCFEGGFEVYGDDFLVLFDDGGDDGRCLFWGDCFGDWWGCGESSRLLNWFWFGWLLCWMRNGWLLGWLGNRWLGDWCLR